MCIYASFGLNELITIWHSTWWLTHWLRVLYRILFDEIINMLVARLGSNKKGVFDVYLWFWGKRFQPHYLSQWRIIVNWIPIMNFSNVSIKILTFSFRNDICKISGFFRPLWINTRRLRKFGWHMAGDIFKWTFANQYVNPLNQISLKCVPVCSTTHKKITNGFNNDQISEQASI